MQLVDAHKLYEQYETAMRELIKSTNYKNISLEALSLLCGTKLIANATTVEAAPVKHARWIKGGYACGENEYKCSACGETEWRTGCARMKYCMCCGAKMDLEEQHD